MTQLDNPPRPAGTLPVPRADATTRLLCAAVRLNPDAANRVLAQVTADRYRALAPPCGVDLVALARYAMRTRNDRARCNLQLAAVCVGTPTVLLAGLAGGLSLSSAALVTALGAVLAWLSVARYQWAVYRDVAALRLSDHNPRDQVPALEEDLEARLDGLERMNVVVFARYRPYPFTSSPFVGSGWHASSWSSPMLDVTRPAKGANGAPPRERVEEFTAADLHEHIARAMCGRPNVTVRERLYVCGDVATGVEGLVPPGRLQPPRSQVGEEVLREGLSHSTELARTYLCLESAGYGGQLVATVFVRVELRGGFLKVLMEQLVLPPLSDVYRARMNDLETGPADLLLRAARAAAATLPHAVTRCFRELQRDRTRARLEWRQDVRQVRGARLGRGHDYGAVASVREVAVSPDDRLLLFHWNDLTGWLQELDKGVKKAVGDFLHDHGIDRTEWDEYLKRHQTVYNIEKVTGKRIIFGDNGQIVDKQPDEQEQEPPDEPPEHQEPEQD